jgi:hypothetical protein
LFRAKAQRSKGAKEEGRRKKEEGRRKKYIYDAVGT